MRTKGSTNKPKFAMVRLGDLTKVINENLEIPVKISFLQELGLISGEVKRTVTPNDNAEVVPKPSIQFTVIN